MIAPTIHAERLHLPDVWSALRRTLDAVERRGRITLFVNPAWSYVAGADISDHLDELSQRGHEIGQHTHFYSWAPDGGSFEKRTDLQPDNVEACLARDHAALERWQPRGFVAGGWDITNAALAWLASRGFEYDCSMRTFQLQYRDNGSPNAARPHAVGRLLEVPTTSDLRGSLTRRRGAYTLYYLHDDDLLKATKAAAFRLGMRGAHVTRVADLVTVLRERNDAQ